jgi:hypothetical protein
MITAVKTSKFVRNVFILYIKDVEENKVVNMFFDPFHRASVRSINLTL